LQHQPRCPGWWCKRKNSGCQIESAAYSIVWSHDGLNNPHFWSRELTCWCISSWLHDTLTCLYLIHHVDEKWFLSIVYMDKKLFASTYWACCHGCKRPNYFG
jgi:hypothetical protein